MAKLDAYVIGLRVDPDVEEADWYTICYEDDQGQNRFAMRDSRVVWSPTALSATRLMDVECDSQVEFVCDMAEAFFAIDHGETGYEGWVLDTLNLLDDLLINIPTAKLPDGRRLDRLASALTIGDPLPAAVEHLGGPEGIVEPMMASLGRVFAHSRFILTPT